MHEAGAGRKRLKLKIAPLIVQRSGRPPDRHVCPSLTAMTSNCLGATDDLRAPTKSGRKALGGNVTVQISSVEYDDDFFVIICSTYSLCYHTVMMQVKLPK